MIFFVVAQIISIVIIFFIAKNMVKNRNGLARDLAIGKDDEKTIEEMAHIAKEIVRTGKFQITDEKILEKYNVNLNVRLGWIDKIMVETIYTTYILELNECTEIIRQDGFSEKGAMAYIMTYLWVYSFVIEGVIAIAIICAV